MVRSETDARLHRLANFVETQMADLLPQLFIESRLESAHEIVWPACNLIEALRSAIDGSGKRGEQ